MADEIDAQTVCDCCGFRPLGEIADAVADAIRAGAPDLRKVTAVALTNAAQLADVIDTITQAPAAVVCLGVVRYPEDEVGFSREIQVIVVVVDQFRAASDRRAAGIWERAEEVAGLFLPQRSDAGAAFSPIADLEWAVESMTPAAGSDRNAMYYINLTAKEYQEYEIQG